MVLFGIPRKLHPDGLLTATAIGIMSALGAGLGSTMRLGALLHFIMAAGATLGAGGVGTRAQEWASRFTVRRLSVSLAAASASDLVSGSA